MDYYKVEAISNSRLNLLDPEMGGSPRKFQEGFDEEEYKYSFEMGTALHKMILEPDMFITADFYRPTENMIKWAEAVEKLGGVTDANILKGKELSGTYANLKDTAKIIDKFDKEGGTNWVQFIKEGKGKIVLKPEDYMALDKAVEAVQNHPRTAELLKGHKEEEVYFNLHGMKCKSKLDNVRFMHDKNIIRVTDVKSTGKNPRRIQNFVEFYRTYRQLAFYGYAAINHPEGLKMSNPDIEYYVIQAGIKPPYECVVGRITQDWITQGRQEIYDLINRIKYADVNGWEFSREEYDSDLILTLDKPEDD